MQLASKAKREHVVVVNTSNIAYPGQQFNVPISCLSGDVSIVPNSPKITFDLDVTSRDKNQGLVNNIGRCIVEKKSLALGGKDIDILDNADIFMIHILICIWINMKKKMLYYRAYKMLMD